MKKIATLAVLPVIALASCSKSNEAPVDTTTDSTTSSVDSTNEVTNNEALNENISTATMDTETWVVEKSFDFTYEINWFTVPVKWKFTIENSLVTAMTFEWINLDEETPLASFAKNAPAQVIWKSLEWLQIDTVSWASYVTMWFNEFLKTFK